MSDKKTDFGYEEVLLKDKQKRVNDVFHNVASKYDMMNDLMSGGLHRVWKRQAMMLARIQDHHCILDLAGGTGDLTHRLFKQNNPKQVVLADINESMLKVGRDRLIDSGLTQVDISVLDAQALPFQSQSFDRVLIGFGLRNVPEKEKALKEILRVLKPGGMLLVLEFSQIDKTFKPAYDLYSFKVLPWLGKTVLNDPDSYQYLAESIRKHPNQQELKKMILEQGFAQCEVHNLSFGMVAVHKAIKGC